MTPEGACSDSSSQHEISQVSGLYELARGNSPQPVLFDPKGDQGIIEALQFLTQGQKAYGEWFKKLTANDHSPRGKCTRFFEAHNRLRQYIGNENSHLASTWQGRAVLSFPDDSTDPQFLPLPGK